MVLPPRSRTMYFAPDSFPAKKNLLLSVDSKCISWQYIEADSGSNAINNWSLFIPAYKKISSVCMNQDIVEKLHRGDQSD